MAWNPSPAAAPSGSWRAFDDHVTITVADDGRGFNSQSSSTGIGRKNLRERLRLTYAGAATFAIVSNFPSGVAATITLPSPLPSSLPPSPRGARHG